MSTTTSREWVKASELPKNYENLHWREAETKRKVDPVAFKYDTMVITDNQEPHESFAVSLSSLEYLEEKEVPVTTDAGMETAIDNAAFHLVTEVDPAKVLRWIMEAKQLIMNKAQSIPSKDVSTNDAVLFAEWCYRNTWSVCGGGESGNTWYQHTTGMTLLTPDLYKEYINYIFKCKGCGHELPSTYCIRTLGYCYLCDPNITVDELLKPTVSASKEQPLYCTCEKTNIQLSQRDGYFCLTCGKKEQPVKETAQEVYERVTLRQIGNNPQGTRMDIVFIAMEEYANQFK